MMRMQAGSRVSIQEPGGIWTCPPSSGSPCATAKSNTDPDATLVQEFDTAGFKGGLDRYKRIVPRSHRLVLDHIERDRRDGGFVRQGSLGPFQQAAGRADLGGADHGDKLYRKLEEI